MTCNNTTFLQEQITRTQATIALYQDAIDAIVVNGAQSYTLDTGQTRQTVTKFNITELEKRLDGLYNRLSTLQARLSGCGTTTGRPAW